MAKGKHHFVPRFYLDAFRSASRRINVYNLKGSLAIRDASLKAQCYRRRFYGRTDEVEDGLAILESHAAPVLHSIRTKQTLPPERTEEYVTLLAFAALQVLRTTAVANRTNVRVDKMMKQVHKGDPRLAGIDLEAVEFGYEDPVLASLRSLPHMLDAVSDLQGHLIVSTANAFVTSDNPASKYNQYCEEIQHMGVTGALCRGLQIYVRPFPGPGGKWKISTGGGTYAVWSRARRELLYLDSDGRIMLVPYRAAGDAFHAEKPRVWSETRVQPWPLDAAHFDLHPDGERVAMAPRTEATAGPTHVTLIFNFFDELRRLAPVK